MPFGFVLGGPKGTQFVVNHSEIEPAIRAMCAHNGDDPDDYTATEVFAKAFRGSVADMATAQQEDIATIRIRGMGNKVRVIADSMEGWLNAVLEGRTHVKRADVEQFINALRKIIQEG